QPGSRHHHDRVQEVRRQPGLYADGARQWPDIDPRPARSVGAVEPGCGHARQLHHPGTHGTPGRDDGGTGLRPELHDRRPDEQQCPEHDRQAAGRRRLADPRQPVQVAELPQGPDRARHRGYAVPGETGRRQRDRAADGRLPRPEPGRAVHWQPRAQRRRREAADAARSGRRASARDRPDRPIRPRARRGKQASPRRWRAPRRSGDTRLQPQVRKVITMHIRRKTAVTTAVALSLGLALSACGDMPNNRSLYSVKQPIVERNNFTLDLATDAGGLSVSEQQRLAQWFETMDLRYGDRVALDTSL